MANDRSDKTPVDIIDAGFESLERRRFVPTPTLIENESDCLYSQLNINQLKLTEISDNMTLVMNAEIYTARLL